MTLSGCCRALTRSVHPLSSRCAAPLHQNLLTRARVSEPQSVMLDLVEDALKDAHDASLLSAYAGVGPGGLPNDAIQ
eukprot:COSAG03_NODE_2479_length_2715_cov_2.887232_3_plen_77_part_00